MLDASRSKVVLEKKKGEGQRSTFHKISLGAIDTLLRPKDVAKEERQRAGNDERDRDR